MSIKQTIYQKLLCNISDEYYLRAYYALKQKKRLNLKSPVLFTEKIQWLKLYDRTSLHTTCADKIAVREYVQQTIGDEFLIPLVCTYNDVDDINLKDLPAEFAMKGAHGSAMNYIVTQKDDVDIVKLKSDFKRWLAIDYSLNGREWQYKNIPRKIVVEKLLLDKNKKVPSDIKIHCFKRENGGFEKFIQIDSDRFGQHSQNFYDSNWNQLDIKFASWSFDPPENSTVIDKPSNLDLLLKLADKLATPFTYVRVDLFVLDDDVYFGELTFHHHSGFSKLNNKWNEKWGKLLDLSLISK